MSTKSKRRIGLDHKDLQAGDTGKLISLVYDFETKRVTEYRTNYSVSYGPGLPPRPGRIVYKMPNAHIKATNEYNKTMSLERIGQYEFMSVKTRPRDAGDDPRISIAPVRFYARVFTIPIRYDFDRAEFWKQLHRHALKMLAQHERMSGYYDRQYTRVPEPAIRPSF
jgi:hypothetical protein